MSLISLLLHSFSFFYFLVNNYFILFFHLLILLFGRTIIRVTSLEPSVRIEKIRSQFMEMHYVYLFVNLRTSEIHLFYNLQLLFMFFSLNAFLFYYLELSLGQARFLWFHYNSLSISSSN